MENNLLALGVPVFLLFMGLEYWVSKKKQLPNFRFSSSVANISVGIAERLLSLFVTGLFYFVFEFIYGHFHFFEIKPSWYNWILLLLCTDFLWYWYHRLGHEINILWAAHVVHHQSEEFNYTSSARITLFQAVFRNGFWAFLPLLGFPPEMVTGILIVHGVYPFFVHTSTIPKLGWLEIFLVTPSHHRVHHASNPEYLDKNYGDVLIIWDKIFGTFQEEKAPPVYGIIHPLGSPNFLWQHFHFFLELVMAAGREANWLRKIGVFFARPDQLSPRYREILERKYRIRKNTGELSAHARRYIVFQMVFTLAALFILSLLFAQLSTVLVGCLALFIFFNLLLCSALLEKSPAALVLECARLTVLMVGVGSEFGLLSSVLSGIFCLVAILLCWPYGVPIYEARYLRTP